MNGPIPMEAEKTDRRNIYWLGAIMFAVIAAMLMVVDCQRRTVERLENMERIKALYAEDRMNVVALEALFAESGGTGDMAAPVAVAELNRFASGFEKRYKPGPVARSAWRRAAEVFSAKHMITPYEKQVMIKAEDLKEVQEAYRDLDWFLKTAMEKGYSFDF